MVLLILIYEDHSPGNVPEVGFHFATIKVDRSNLALQHANVLLLRQDAANRSRNIGGTQPGHCNLIQQRLEQMVVSSVNQGDMDVSCSTKSLCCVQTRKAAAHNDYACDVVHSRIVAEDDGAERGSSAKPVRT